MPVLVVGHYCHDTIVRNAGVHRALGGSAAYVSAILDAAGQPHAVVAKVGADFLYGEQVSQKPLVVAGPTTAFVDDYRGAERRERVDAVAAAIEPEDLSGRFEVGIACGIAGEVPLRTLRRVREISRLVVADAQSILRVVGADGEVLLRTPEAGTVECIDVLKASRAEAAVLDVAGLRKRLTVIVTDGVRGCDVLGPDGELHVPAFPATEVDPTGAGDCFLAGLGLALLRGVPVGNAALHNAALQASWFGARAVEHVGVPRLTREEARGGLEAP